MAMPPLMQRLGKMNRRAFANYRPRPYGGTITLFRASKRWPRFCDPLPVWRQLTEGRVVVRMIAGLHNELVVEPQVELLAHDVEQLISANHQIAA